MMTTRQQALIAYFYTVATDPGVRAAGHDPRKFAVAFLSCIEEDLPAVLKTALGGLASPVGVAARGFAARMVAADRRVSPALADALGGTAEAVVSDIFAGLSELVSRATRKKKDGAR